jgi:arylsulfatase A-like enzyme
MGWPLDLKHRTIIDYMNEAGYETILSGVNHERHPRSDRYEVDVTRSWEDWSADRDTIVIFTTDHGISNARSKGTLYQRGVEIALLVRMPDRSKAGTVIRHLTQKIDNTPIILEAVGAPVPAELQGRSYWPLLSGGDYAPHEAIFMERSFHGERPFPGVDGFIDQFDPVRAVRTMDFHYIRWFNPDLKARPLLPFEIKAETDRKGPIEEIGAPASREPRNAEELYHARHDPQEFVNVAGRPEYEKSAPLWRKGSSTGCEKRTTFSLAEKRRLAPRSAAGDRTGHSRIKTLQYS